MLSVFSVAKHGFLSGAGGLDGLLPRDPAIVAFTEQEVIIVLRAPKLLQD